MVRPRHEQPTPAELEVLQVLWDAGPATVRQVMRTLNRTRRRAYTSVMSLMAVMADKGLLTRRPEGRAFVYAPAVSRRQTLSGMLADLIGRAFAGSTNLLVSHLLDQSDLTAKELAELQKTIAAYRRQRGEKP